HLPGDFLEGLENTLPLEGNCLDHRFALALKFAGEGFDWKNVWKVTLVQLQHIGNFVEVIAVLFQVGHQVVESFSIGVHALFLGISDEHNAVYAAQNQLAAGVIKNLAGHGVEMNAGLETTHRAQVQRKKVEEQRSLRLRGERDHFALL